MYNLVIDIGNTNSKVAVFKGNALIEFRREPDFGRTQLESWLDRYEISCASMSSVSGDAGELAEVLKARVRFIPISINVKTGINNKYGTPGTLGMDRWAKLIASFSNYKGRNCLIIDSGTCITYDLLTDSGDYYGGSISPGINMRFKAVHNYTGKLPLVSWDRDAVIPDGNNTENAIRNGVLQGYLNEVVGFIAHYNEKYNDLKVLITGGDAGFLCLQLKNSIFAPQITEDPLLVLKGLNEVITLETCI